MKSMLIISVILSSLVSFAQQDVEKIIGDNDLVAVDATGSNIPLKYRGILDAFGHIKSMGCSGTHIGNGYVLTAGHCFWATSVAMKDKDCADTTIEWGMRDGVTPYMTSQCEKIIIAQKGGPNDFAIFKVSPIPPVAIAPDMNRHAATGDTVTIFSHPEDLPLRWSRLCGVERVQHPDLSSGALQHQCDTNPSSSGATIINALSLKVVGIHDGGVYGDDTDKYSPVGLGMNFGTFILNSPLAEALRDLGFN